MSDRICRDCYFFENKLRFGRKKRSCSELGETPSHYACSAFVDKEGMPERTIPDEFFVARALTARRRQKPGLHPATVTDSIRGLLDDWMALDGGVQKAVKDLLVKLHQQGIDVAVDPTFLQEFERNVDTVVGLWSLYALANTLGLSSFADDLVRARIAQLFPSAATRAGTAAAPPIDPEPVEPPAPPRKRMAATGEVFKSKRRGAR